MQKIPTLFVRDESNPRLVTEMVTSGCEWVLSGEGKATRKYDGTNVRVTVRGGKCAHVEKRRNPSREEKKFGAEPGYVDASRDDASNKWIFAAVDATDFSDWPDGAWSCEAVGPKIQGGPDGLDAGLVPFSLPSFVETHAVNNSVRTFDDLKAFLANTMIEGIVWHHSDGRMAKIKRRDFGFKWPV